MAIQSFSVGQVLTAAQVNALQANDYNQTVNAKTASYTLVAADKGTRITMSSTSATTITVNTSLFSAGDTLFIQNLNTGVTTITAGTATVTTASSLALAQWEGGTLYFTSASAAIFIKGAGAAAGGGGKVLQVVQQTYSTSTSIASTSYNDTGLTGTITPTLATSKILVMTTQGYLISNSPDSGQFAMGYKLNRDIAGGGYSVIYYPGDKNNNYMEYVGATITQVRGIVSMHYLDSPATTSAVSYKTTAQTNSTASGQNITFQPGNASNEGISTLIMMEIGV